MTKILTPKSCLTKSSIIFSKMSYLIRQKKFRDSDPPGMDDDIKNKVKLKHKLCHRYKRHSRDNEDFAKLEDLPNEVDNLISKSKKRYYQKSTESYMIRQQAVKLVCQ